MGRFFAHLIAIVVGAVFVVVGLGMGVSMVMLPIGIPVGLVGVLPLAWGLLQWSRTGSGI